MTTDLETIAALATAPGEAAIAVVRVSGPDVRAIAGRVFEPAGRLSPRRSVFGRIVKDGVVIDEVVATFFAGPASYTGEDVLEISGHGGGVVAGAVLRTVLDAGARAAEPGEFTQRAFLNGKMDLTQAEAVMDLITARTPLAARAATEQLAGRIGSEVAGIREDLLDAVANLEAAIDFPEEGISPAEGEALQRRFAAVRARIVALLATADEGRILREGARLVIAGRPNAGKSSLLNRLAGLDRAIVSELPGTTRDTIEEMLNLRGIPFRVVDTAGLRETVDAVEGQGVARARAAIENADFVLHVIDGAAPDESSEVASDALRIWNKVDLGGEVPDGAIGVSCLTGDGIDRLVDVLVERVRGGSIVARSSAAAINARHQACLARALEFLDVAAAALRDGVEPEFVAVDLRVALDAAGEVVGRADTEEILGRIFSSFCIGK